MSESNEKNTSRREFLKSTGRLAASSAVVAGIAPRIHAAGSSTVNVALIGCGGRGTGAAANALSVNNGPTKLVAMGDVFEARLKSSYANLKRSHASKMDVP